MVRLGRLPARRIGPHWYIEEAVLEEFASSYQRPRHRTRRKPPTSESREKVARLLAEWQEATADELAVGIDLHPGNVRKHLVILEAAGVADRDDEGFWRLTQAGRRLYDRSAQAS